LLVLVLAVVVVVVAVSLVCDLFGPGWVLVVERGPKKFKIVWLKDLNSESHHQNPTIRTN
jgi:hypothetical protein